MARLNEKQKDETRKKIIEAARRHFIAEGYEATSTRRLAREAGIAEGTLFNYFGSKADLMLEVVAIETAERRLPAASSAAGDNLTELINSIVISYIGKILIFPKRIMKDVLTAGLGMAKKNPDLFRRLAESDYRVIEELEDFLNKAGRGGILREFDYRMLSESIISQAFFEFMIYLYEDDYSREDFETRIKKKIEFTVQPYLK